MAVVVVRGEGGRVEKHQIITKKKLDLNPEINAIMDLSGEKAVVDAVDALTSKMMSYNKTNVLYYVNDKTIERLYAYLNNIKNSFSTDNNMRIMHNIDIIVRASKSAVGNP